MKALEREEKRGKLPSELRNFRDPNFTFPEGKKYEIIKVGGCCMLGVYKSELGGYEATVNPGAIKGFEQLSKLGQPLTIRFYVNDLEHPKLVLKDVKGGGHEYDLTMDGSGIFSVSNKTFSKIEGELGFRPSNGPGDDEPKPQILQSQDSNLRNMV